MTLRWVTSALFALLLAGCDAALLVPDAGSLSDAARPDAAPDDAGSPPEALDGFIAWQMNAGGIPGAAAAIVRDGEVAWVGTYGFADIESGREVDAHTLFTTASISKTFASVLALSLVEEERFDLDAPLETYLDHALRHPEHPEIEITARMLLTHTSGLEDNWLALGRAAAEGAPPASLSEFAAGYVLPEGEYYGERNWGAAPGERYAYCNAGFGVLGAALEAVTGDLPSASRDRIFDVLELDEPAWLLAGADASRLATPYGFNGRRFSASSHQDNAFYPASTLRISVTGLARFLLMVAGGGALEEARVLGEASVEEMLRPQVPELRSGQALAWSERTVNGHRYIGHSGSAVGVSTQMLLSREGTHGIILLTNSDAYVRATFGMTAGREAMEAILSRLDAEAREGSDGE